VGDWGVWLFAQKDKGVIVAHTVVERLAPVLPLLWAGDASQLGKGPYGEGSNVGW
jgi:hypothetical protein